METLGNLIRLGRTRRKLTQDELAENIRTSKQRISNIERDVNLPTIEQLVDLFNELAEGPDQRIVWLLKWLVGMVQNKLGDKAVDFQKVIEEADTKLNHQTRAWTPGTLRSLEYFPEAFEPLTIICGDRRESKPKTRADLFAYSVAATDFMFLPHLDLRDRSTMVRPDKLFILMDDEYLTRTFGERNLLVIGSPAVNYVTRLINRRALFQFDLDSDLRGWEENLRSASYLDDENNASLDEFWRIIQKPKRNRREPSPKSETDDGTARIKTKEDKELVELSNKLMDEDDPKSLLNRFRKLGLVDLADGKLHGTRTGDDNDFGLVSLALNPFAKTMDYVCIMVAGIHGPGTAQAMKVLANKNNFQGRPFGGIIEVKLNRFADWPTRFERASWNWQTESYEPQDILTNLETALKQDVTKQKRVFARLHPEDIKECTNFVRSLIGVSDSSL